MQSGLPRILDKHCEKQKYKYQEVDENWLAHLVKGNVKSQEQEIERHS